MPGHRAFSLVGHRSSQPGGPSPAALRSRLRWAPEAAPPLTTADSSIARCDCRRSRQPSVGGEGPQRMIAPRRALSRQAEPTLVASPPIAVVVRERSSQSDPAPRILPRFWQNARDRQQNHQSQSSHECIEYRRYTSMRARCRADVDSARPRNSQATCPNILRAGQASWPPRATSRTEMRHSARKIQFCGRSD
jgi:hypothetical protein